MGYLPCNSDRRDSTLERKRKEYEEYREQSFKGIDAQLQHQIHIDIQRTNAHIPLYQVPLVQEVWDF